MRDPCVEARKLTRTYISVSAYIPDISWAEEPKGICTAQNARIPVIIVETWLHVPV